jgi:hypothetical protein
MYAISQGPNTQVGGVGESRGGEKTAIATNQHKSSLDKKNCCFHRQLKNVCLKRNL